MNFFFKLKVVLFLSFVLSILAVISISYASDGEYDLAITDVNVVPCIQDADLDSELYDAFFGGNDRELTYDISHTAVGSYGEYLAGEWDSNLEMEEVASDGSWYVYHESDSNILGTTSNMVICVAIEFTGEGNFEDFAGDSDDLAPTSWESFLDYTSQDFNLSVALVPSEGMDDHTLETYFYTEGSKSFPMVETENVREENVFFFPLQLVGQNVDPEGSFDLVASVDNDISVFRGIFYRDFFDGIRHYNEGPVIAETDETNNYLYIPDFFSLGMDQLPEPQNMTISDSDSDSFTITWDTVVGADHYHVYQYRDRLGEISLEEVVGNIEQTETSFVATLDGSDNVMDCVFVTPIDSEDVVGHSSDNVCFGSLFSDVDDGLWYSSYTFNAVQNGLISGYLDKDGEYTGEFGPADTITTSQALKIVSELAVRIVNPSMFAFDLPYSIPVDLESHWASTYILTADILGYDLVSDIDSFDPDADITRAEIVNLIMEAMDVDMPSYSIYSLSDIEGTPYADEIQLAYDLGIISGYDGGDEFGPDNSLLRAEAVKIFVEAGNAFQGTWPGYEF